MSQDPIGADPPIARHQVRVGEHLLSYLDCGSGPAIVLLHGWPTNALLWRVVLPRLAKAGFRAIAPDLPGYGQSDKPLTVSYSFRFYDRVLSGLCEALALSEIALVVHDAGGPIGLHWAAGGQVPINRLVLLNTLVFPDFSWAVKLFFLGTVLPGVRRGLTSPWGLGAAMRFGVVDKARITPEVAAIYQSPFPDRASRKALLKAVQGLHPAGFETIVEGLRRSDVPTYLLYGTQDRILPDVARTMTRVQELIPHAVVETLPCGHFLQEDRPTEVADRLAAWFANAGP